MQLNAFLVIGQTPSGEIVGHSNVPHPCIDQVLAHLEKLKYALLVQEAKARAENKIVTPPVAAIPGLRA